MRKFLLCALATLGLAIGATVVWGVGAAVTVDPSTGKTYPQQVNAGYIATADGGVVAVLNSAKPTAVGQALRSTTTGTAATAGFVNDPAATTTAAGVVREATSARIAATTSTNTASTTASTFLGSDAQCILPKATTTAWGVSEFDSTSPKADGVPSVGTGGLELQSNHVHPTEGVARTVYYPTGSGGVAPTSLSRFPQQAADSFAFSATTTQAQAMSVSTASSDPGLLVYSAGTYKLRVFAYATATTNIDFAIFAAGGYFGGSGVTQVAVGASFTEYDLYFATTSDNTNVSPQAVTLWLTAWTPSGTSTITFGMGGVASTSLITPWPTVGLQNIAGQTGNISQVPCVGTYTNITTNTGTSTNVNLCTIPIGSASAPSLLQLSTTTPLGNAASGSVGTGTTAARADHVHPISSSGLIYYATSGAGFSTTMPGATTELTQAMAAGSATINLATSSGTPGLSVWPAGAINFDVWAYMSAMGSGCTYLLNNFQTAAVRGASTAYQTGGGSAGATLTGSYAEYKYTVPVGQLTGTSTDIFKTPIIVTSTNSPTCNAATLHIGIGTGQASNVGTLFYQVPSLDGVEYQANKNQPNGYCPLDSNVLVPVANLPAVTESTAGAMSAADKTKLDGIASGATVDAFTVKAYSGATPNYLTSVMTSPNTTISLGVDTSNHVTIDVNAIAESQVTNLVSDLTGKQSTLPSGTNGQVLGYSVTGTGTTTNLQPLSLGESNISGLVTDLASKIATSSIGVANGVAGLGTDSKVAAGNLPGSTTTAPGITQLSSQARIATTTSTATASSTAMKAMPEDAKVIVPVGTTSGAGIVQLGATGGAEPTLPACAPGQLVQWGTTSATGTGTSTSTTTTKTCQNPSWATSTGTGLGTSTRGAVLYNGSTATGTDTSSSPVWGAPPAVPLPATNTPYSDGSGNVGTSTKYAREDHTHALPSASGSVAGICLYGTTAGTCVQGNDARLAGNPVKTLHSVALSTTMAIGDYPSWHSLLSFSVGSATGGSVMVHATMTARSLYANVVHVILGIDGVQFGGQYTSVLSLYGGSYGEITISPVGYISFGAGSHIIDLEAYSDYTSCVVQGADQITGGSAILIGTEYTN
jgi:hypothetical protein